MPKNNKGEDKLHTINVRFGKGADGQKWSDVIERAREIARKREDAKFIETNWWVREVLLGDPDFIQAMKELGIKELVHPAKRGTYKRMPKKK